MRHCSRTPRSTPKDRISRAKPGESLLHASKSIHQVEFVAHRSSRSVTGHAVSYIVGGDYLVTQPRIYRAGTSRQNQTGRQTSYWTKLAPDVRSQSLAYYQRLSSEPSTLC